MAKLSAEEIAGVVKYYSTRTAPITERNGIIAVAIALAESGGDPKAVGGPNTNGTRDWGLWQINDIHKPYERAKDSPAANWLMAYQISSLGTNWRPWATYQSGKYNEHMAAATAAYGKAAPGTIGGDASGEVTNPDTDYQLPEQLAFLNPLLDEDTWLRVAMAIAGGFILLLVVAAIVKNSGAIAKALPIAKAIKKVG